MPGLFRKADFANCLAVAFADFNETRDLLRFDTVKLLTVLVKELRNYSFFSAMLRDLTANKFE